jgi:hypothetical protein
LAATNIVGNKLVKNDQQLKQLALQESSGTHKTLFTISGKAT